MSILKVLNVGQGDSIIITPPNGCSFKDKAIFVDLGPGQHDITEHISNCDRVHIFLTHHDADHFDGMKFFVNKMSLIDEITLPFYQNEITLIAKCILNLKGIYSAKDCGEFIRLLEDVVNNQIYLKKLADTSENGIRLSFAYENVRFCNHIICLNPPIVMNTFNWLIETSIDELSEVIYEIFEPTFAHSFNNYLRNRRIGSHSIDSKEIAEITLDDKVEYYDNYGDEIYSLKSSYVVNFIMRNLDFFRRFNTNPTRKILKVIYDDYVSCTHDACIILKAEYQNKSFLLTGDSSKKVFYRLINNNVDISANYLKVPHHGSRYNISNDILKKIDPDVAIISHNNRRFCRAADSHPNMEVLEMLMNKGIKIMLTNDVYKHGIKCMEKSNHLGDHFVEII